MSVCQGSPAYMCAELLLGLCPLRYTCFFRYIHDLYRYIYIYIPESLYINAVYSCISLDYVYSHKLILLYPPVILAIHFRRRSEKQKFRMWRPNRNVRAWPSDYWLWLVYHFSAPWMKGYPKKMMIVNDGRKFQKMAGVSWPPIFVGGKMFRFPAVWV